MTKWPMVYLGCPIKSKVGLYGLIKLVGIRVRSGTGGNKEAGERMIAFAHKGGWITAHECTLLHALLSPNVQMANSIRCKGSKLDAK